MKTAHSRIHAVVTATALTLSLALAACANAKGGEGETADARLDGDGAPIPDPPDANPNAPDANPNNGVTDANTSSCVKTPCDLVPQCGCLSTEACDLDSTNFATGGTECRNIAIDGMEASTCNNVEDCAAGYVCLGGASSQCRRYCSADTDCPGDGSLCLIQITYGTGMDVPGAKVCSKDCNPLAKTNPTGCPSPNYACHIYLNDPDGMSNNGDESSLTDCTSAGAGTDGTACTSSSDCAPGYDCINSGGSTACRENCLRPNGACSIGGYLCRGLTPAAMVGAVEYGTCIP